METNKIPLNFTVSHSHLLSLVMITLHIKQLKKSFGPKNIFRDLSFSHSGGALGIAGPNGSGKSTLLRCMAGLLSPTGGNISWTDGTEKLSGEHVQQRIGYAAPYINLYDELNCLENLQFLSQVRFQNGSNHSIKKWIRKAGLREVANQPYGKLSTGQQQRLRLASALFHHPDILLLDEPGSNLDADGEALVTKIAAMFRTSDKLLVIASNNRQELDLCDRIFSVEEQAFL